MTLILIVPYVVRMINTVLHCNASIIFVRIAGVSTQLRGFHWLEFQYCVPLALINILCFILFNWYLFGLKFRIIFSNQAIYKKLIKFMLFLEIYDCSLNYSYINCRKHFVTRSCLWAKCEFFFPIKFANGTKIYYLIEE